MKNKIIAIFHKHRRNRLLFFIIFSIPVLVFFYQYLMTGTKLIGGDFDYYVQLQEAFRISLLRYHQFPLWNPWMSGGVPLFANPQFGLISLQSLTTLLFGAVYGLKIAYVCYALAGFWGMYQLCRTILNAGKVRSLLLSYIWVFNGFFAGHSISHFTFALLFLSPWLLYFLARWRLKWTWLYLGLLEALLVLSSLHYAFLMTSFVVIAFALLAILSAFVPLPFDKVVRRSELIAFIKFGMKTAAVFLIVAGYRMALTLLFVSSNPKIPELLVDHPYPPLLIAKALFLPIGTHLPVPGGLQWGWAEYSMYAGLGFTFALVVCVIGAAYFMWCVLKKHTALNWATVNWGFLLIVLAIGAVCASLALGDFSNYSPFHLLRALPGFSQTRVAIRWMIFALLAALLLVAVWPRNSKLITILLGAAAVELFISYGPPTLYGQGMVSVEKPRFSTNFTQYDNGYNHLDAAKNQEHFYYFTTMQNRGQIYSDDSIINTLNKVYGSTLCGENTTPGCKFVRSHNANVIYWSPNGITLKRTGPGEIILDMNAAKGWMVNDSYIFASLDHIDPTTSVIIPDDHAKTYNLEYAPFGSWAWLHNRL